MSEEEIKERAEDLIRRFLKIEPELKEANRCAMLLVDYCILEGDAWIQPHTIRHERREYWQAIKGVLRSI